MHNALLFLQKQVTHFSDNLYDTSDDSAPDSTFKAAQRPRRKNTWFWLVAQNTMFRVGLGVLDILMIQEYIGGTYCHIDFKATFKGIKPNIFTLNFEIIIASKTQYCG